MAPTRKRFQFLPKTATADVAFKAFGATEAKLCENAAAALESVMVDLKSIKPNKTLNIDIQEPTIDKLLFKFLDELVFLKDAEQFLASKFSVKIAKAKSSPGKRTDKNLHLVAQVKGQKIDTKTMILHNDIKAVTYHMFEVKRAQKRASQKGVSKSGYECTVLVDV